jgi:glycosyltransferase involved in cell wall biosynthesis
MVVPAAAGGDFTVIVRKPFEEKAKALGVSDQCFFEGNVNNVEQYLWDADIYVHTATYEPLGLVLLEAMAAGLTVVTLDGGGNRDLMIDGKNGYLLYDENQNLFVDKILNLWENLTSLKRIAEIPRIWKRSYWLICLWYFINFSISAIIEWKFVNPAYYVLWNAFFLFEALCIFLQIVAIKKQMLTQSLRWL